MTPTRYHWPNVPIDVSALEAQVTPVGSISESDTSSDGDTNNESDSEQGEQSVF